VDTVLDGDFPPPSFSLFCPLLSAKRNETSRTSSPSCENETLTLIQKQTQGWATRGIPSPRQMSTQSPPNHPRTTHSLESRVSEKPSVGVTCWKSKKPFNRFLVLVLVLVFPSLLVK